MFFKQKPYKVKLHGRSEIDYTEGEHKAIIGAEMLTGDKDLVIYLEELNNWEIPFENEVISDEAKKRIKTNITEELEKNGLILDWS